VKTREDMKIGMIGSGVHAKANIYASLELLQVPIQAVCTRHLEAAQATAARYRAPSAYADYRTMLECEKLDAVFVVTDAGSQAAITKDCLEAGTHVFVEKPLGMNAAQAAEVGDLAARVQRQVMVGFMKRFAPAYMMQKEIMNNTAEFGRKVSFSGMFAITSGRPGWTDEVYLKVGGIHYIDLLREFFGELVDVSGYTNSVDVKVDQVFSMRFDSGVIGSMFLAGLPAWKRHWEEMTVTGENGFVNVANMLSVRYHYDRPPATRTPRWQTMDEEDRVLTPVSTSSSGGWRDLYLNGYVGEVEHFLGCVASNTAPLTSAASNVKTMALCDAILAGLRA
jgi:UDP-N-acetylglucosamine 3-dehydrogenase